MNKTLKRTLAVLAMIAGVFLIFVIIMIFRYSYAMKQMTPAETHAINDSVFCIRDKYVNAYIFKGYDGYLMIDGGINKNRVIEELSKLEINPDDILTVILTHSDPDHSGALKAFENAKIFLHEEEEQMVTGETARFIFKSKWKYDDYNLIRSDEILNINVFLVRVLHTPGHTPGSCCFIVNDDYLLTGDNLIILNGKYTNFFDIINMDTETQIESIRKLPPPSEFKYILTSHTGMVPGDEL
ncbi:MAG: MBL fold metallo-hydrolase [Bacteroidales bacterium]|nr:MBL fold metallo-hydrolase [Bacteroidales bacterium]